MDIEFNSVDQKLDFTPIESVGRSKTSLRMRYESEARVWLGGVGGLEGIRTTLGLSQRKICQLLLVDPSAWTRWVKTGRTPPHIIRSLQWYTELEKKDASWAQWREQILKREPDPQWVEWQKKIESKINDRSSYEKPTESLPAIAALQSENAKLTELLEKRETLGVGFKLALLFNTAWVLWSLFDYLF